MLHYIKGKLALKIDGGVVVENGGIGYEINVPDNSSVYLASEGENVTLYLSMIVREDDVSLYGFAEKEGLALFKQLITVNGVGAKAAMAVLSIAPVGEIKRAIAFEDDAFITRANGVGKKTAQRIVLELKDKMGTIESGSSVTVSEVAVAVSASDQRNEAVSALMALGYSKMEASNAIGAIAEQNLSSEEYIKLALKKLF